MPRSLRQMEARTRTAAAVAVEDAGQSAVLLVGGPSRVEVGEDAVANPIGEHESVGGGDGLDRGGVGHDSDLFVGWLSESLAAMSVTVAKFDEDVKPLLSVFSKTPRTAIQRRRRARTRFPYARVADFFEPLGPPL